MSKIKKPKSKLEWFKKNIVIVPVIAAIIAGTFTSVRYVLNLTDTITANQETIIKLKKDLIIQELTSMTLNKDYQLRKQHGQWQKIYTDN